MVGAVLTQNTAWGNVNRSLAALNAEGVLEPHKLAIMGPAHLQELIRPSGFYVNKSKTVQSLSRWYVERCGASPEARQTFPTPNCGPNCSDYSVSGAKRPTT